VKSETARSILFENEEAHAFRPELTTKLDKASIILSNIKKLTETVHELETELMEGEFDYYSTIADLIGEVNTQLSFFESFSASPHIVLITEKVKAIQSEVKRQVQWSFREIGELVSVSSYVTGGSASSSGRSVGDTGGGQALGSSGKLPTSDGSVNEAAIAGLNQIDLVVDALGANYRYDTLERFAQLQFISYEKHFTPTNTRNMPHADIEHLDVRFMWFKQLLSVAQEKLSIYIPNKWGLKTHLYLEFARRTIHHISDALRIAEAASADGCIDVHVLLVAVKSVLSFEDEIRRELNLRPREELLDDSEHTDDSGHNAQQQQQAPEDSQHGAQNAILYGTSMATNGRSVVLTTSKICMADAFDPFLGPYIQTEREGLESLMEKSLDEEEKDGLFYDDNGPIRPKDAFASSLKMFEYIKKALKRCKQFSTGFTYLALSKEFRICLHNYAGARVCVCWCWWFVTNMLVCWLFRNVEISLSESCLDDRLRARPTSDLRSLQGR
jgi:hypothetical protein